MDRMRSKLAADNGLSLLEVIVAIAILTVVATASATLTLTGIAAAATQERRQIAVTIASGAMEKIGAQSVSSLYAGRTATTVRTAWQSYSSYPGVAQTYPFSDAAATSTTSAPQAGTTYTVATLVGTCYLRVTGGDCGTISGLASIPAAVPTGYTDLIRVIVIVSWTAGRTCASGCTYTTSSLIDPSADLVWVTRG